MLVVVGGDCECVVVLVELLWQWWYINFCSEKVMITLGNNCFIRKSYQTEGWMVDERRMEGKMHQLVTFLRVDCCGCWRMEMMMGMMMSLMRTKLGPVTCIE